MKKWFGSIRDQSQDWVILGCMLTVLAGALWIAWCMNPVTILRADNFTDIFYTNSFRGSFEWFKKLDWIGMVVQVVISVFSLVGVALIVIRIMTSMLYLSAKGLWEEVHDLKQSGGESELYDFGLTSMAKSWAKGKAGTGVDAILGAILILLPDVKRYSDFGEKSGQKFDEDTTISQYMLKIALPTVLAVFFLAMGFNGTLVKGLAVTVDAMGTIADKAVSVNYAGFVEDLINKGSGYKFTYEMEGTNQGKLAQSIATDLYGRVIAEAHSPSQAQLYQIGLNIQNQIGMGDSSNLQSWCTSDGASTNISTQIREGLSSGNDTDRFYAFLGHNIVVNTSEQAAGAAVSIPLSTLMEGVGMAADEGTVASQKYYHIYIKSTGSYDGVYWNTDDLAG